MKFSRFLRNSYLFSILFDNVLWKQKAVILLRNLSELIVKYPTSFGNWASLFIDVFADINEIAICGNGFENLRDELLQHFIPNKVLQCTNDPNENKYPLIAKKRFSKQPLLYLCRNYTCSAPVDNVQEIVNEIVNKTKFK